MNTKGGLGRGLSSLIPNKKIDNQSEVLNKKDDFFLPTKLEQETGGQLISDIAIEKISPNHQQPRQHFDEQALTDLANSIKEHGILQPLVISKLTNGSFEIIAGERRFRAAQKIGLTTVPAIIRNVTEQQKLEIAIIENIQRENFNPTEEAKAYQRLNNEFNLTHEEIAHKTGKSRSQITNMIRLLELPARIQEALTNNEITVGHAKTIASLSDEAEQMELFKTILRGHLNVRETEKASNKIKILKPSLKNKILKNADLIEQEEVLRNALSTKINIKKSGGRGKIEIEFYSEEELNNIIDKIIK